MKAQKSKREKNENGEDVGEEDTDTTLKDLIKNE
jgi:hypothetical protein